jgi:AhpD family alkylhydroperoxidase
LGGRACDAPTLVRDAQHRASRPMASPAVRRDLAFVATAAIADIPTTRTHEMTQRLDYQQQSPELFKKFVEFNMSLKKGAIEEAIVDLVSVRASQINGCAFCVDMHVKQATIHGERPLRLHHLAAWRESPLFSPRERAALAWTEVLTQLPPHGVPDDVYERVRTQLSEKEITELTYSIMAINGWNRINVAFQSLPGSLDKAWGLDKANLG